MLTAELRQQLPALYSTDGQGDKAIARVKYFTPDSSWYWYGVEFDGQDAFFGLVFGQEVELGYFSLSELETARGPLNLPIERDLGFEPTTLGNIKRQHRKLEGNEGRMSRC